MTASENACSDGGGAGPEQAEVVTGIIQGDRVCIECGFNLCGQRIVREPRYNLLIARCPECGQAAALQEHPLLGRWANRWAATLAGLWLVMFAVLSIGAGMTIFGMAVSATEISSMPVQNEIAEMHNAWKLETDPNAQANMYWGSIDPDWWETVDSDAIFEKSSGVAGIFWRASQTTWIALFFAMITFGGFASVALLGVTRSRLVLTAFAPLSIAIVASILYLRNDPFQLAGGTLYVYYLAREMVWMWTIPTTIVLGGVFLILGMLVGRPLARLLARTVLPNRFVQSLAVLWTSVGLEPPRSRR